MPFPLPWERVHWRMWRYALTDFRIVILRRGRVVRELAVHDLATIRCRHERLRSFFPLGTIVVTSTRPGDPPLELQCVVRPAHTAARLALLVSDLRGLPPDEGARVPPMPRSWRVAASSRLQVALVAPSLVLLTLLIIVIRLSGYEVRVDYANDDPVRPNGVPRPRAEVVAFMEGEVLPWARKALAPVMGSRGVRCETCHGASAEARGWEMPAVRALPEPAVRRIAPAAGSDSQMRNALHGYAAEGDNQAVAAYMRGVVVPGMSRLLRRPPYDFAQTYEYNRARAAFGCYHCHVVAE